MSVKFLTSIADRKIEKSVGASTHPCLTPFVIANVSDTSHPFLRLSIYSVCRLSVMFVNYSGNPCLFVDGDYADILPGLWYMAFLTYLDDPSVQSVGQNDSPVFPYFCWNSISTGFFTIF